jgi:RHS repeat-associated protein
LLVNRYQYNGIELLDDWGLNLNTARYRTLDPQLGRWWQIDPEVEQFEAWSAYNSNLDNPIRYEDKDGDTPSGGGNNPENDALYKNDAPEGAGGGGGGGTSGMTSAQIRMRDQKELAEYQLKYPDQVVNPKPTPVQAYEVGPHDELQSRSVKGDNIEVHHAIQGNPAKQTIPGYNYKKGASIALPKGEHKTIPTQKGTAKLTPRQQLAKDIKDLRNKTNAPTVNLQKLIELNKQMYGASLSKQTYLDLRNNQPPQ